MTVAVWLLLMLPATAENDAAVDPPGTITEVGTVNCAFLERVMATVDPPLGAAEESMMVHTADSCEASVAGVQASPLTVGGAAGGGGGAGASCRPKLLDVPLSDATNVAVVFELTAAAVALNPALIAPAAMLAEAGALTLAAPPATPNDTTKPPLGAAADAVTVHDAVPGVVSGFGAQVNPVNVVGWLMVTVPPLPVTAIGFPAASEAEGLNIPTPDDVLVVDGETESVIVATTPLAIVFALIPTTRQV